MAVIDHVAPVGGDGGAVAAPVCAAARYVLRDQRGGIVQRVVKKNVSSSAIEIVCHQVGCSAVVDHIAPVGGDSTSARAGGVAGVVAAVSGGCFRYECDGHCLLLSRCSTYRNRQALTLPLRKQSAAPSISPAKESSLVPASPTIYAPMHSDNGSCEESRLAARIVYPWIRMTMPPCRTT